MTAATARAKSRNRKELQASASPWDGGRRPREHALKREAVILAAARAFAQRGYHNVSLDDLAASLKVTKPTLYLYVPNKEAILFECFRAGLEQISPRICAVCQDSDFGRLAGEPARWCGRRFLCSPPPARASRSARSANHTGLAALGVVVCVGGVIRVSGPPSGPGARRHGSARLR